MFYCDLMCGLFQWPFHKHLGKSASSEFRNVLSTHICWSTCLFKYIGLQSGQSMLLSADNDSFLFFPGQFQRNNGWYSVTCPGFLFDWCLSWCHLNIYLLLYVVVERSELSLVDFFPRMWVDLPGCWQGSPLAPDHIGCFNAVCSSSSTPG